MGRVGIILLYIAIFLGPGLLSHELGHALGAVLAGGEVTQVAVAPGLQLYPDLQRTPWEGQLGWVRTRGVSTDRDLGLMQVLGCGVTLTVALVASLLLQRRRRGGVGRHVLLAFSLFFLDALTYSTLPLVGLRHWGPVGGRQPEPLVALERLGVPTPVGLTVVVLLSLVCAACIVLHLRRVPPGQRGGD